jgi:hypothetical protein
LEWLNDQTIEGVGFFGVELELLRIDDSKAAPHFRVVVQPNEWVKEARSANPKTPPVSWSWEKFERVLGISTEKIELAQAICAEAERVIAERELPWKQYFGKGFVTYKRPGEYNVLDIDLKWHSPVRFAVKIPKSPSDLNLADPFPPLQSLWLPREREWGWTIPHIEAIPDLSGPIELSAEYQPPTGPMKAQ